MRTKTIYTRWMAYELRKLGHRIVSIQPNPHKPEFDMWIFKDSPRFESDLTKLTKDAKDKLDEGENKDERREEDSQPEGCSQSSRTSKSEEMVKPKSSYSK